MIPCEQDQQHHGCCQYQITALASCPLSGSCDQCWQKRGYLSLQDADDADGDDDDRQWWLLRVMMGVVVVVVVVVMVMI